MDIKIILDRVTSFIMDPGCTDRKPVSQGLAWAATIFLGIGTLGIVQGISALWRKLRHIEKNETHEKIARLFKKSITPSKHSPSVTEKTPPAESPKETESTTASPSDRPDSPTKLSPLQKTARSVYDRREELWTAAEDEAKRDRAPPLIILIQKIREEFKKNGLSLSQISSDTKAFNILCQSLRLRLVIVHYAKLNNLAPLLDKHLVLLAQNTYENRETYTQQAAKNANLNPIEQLMCLTLVIQTTFKQEGRSLREIINNTEALEIFQKSHRLSLVLDIYARKKMELEREPSKKSRPRELEGEQAQEALRLAKKDAEGPGLVTRLRLNRFELDEEKLHKALREFLLTHQPDKNPEIDPELVNDATQLLDLLKNGVYEIYRQTKEKMRASL
jgi:hypothetical protein